MTDNNVLQKVVIAGAGNIGCFVGGMLASGGSHVHFFARPRIAQDITNNGLHLSDWSGLDTCVTPQQFTVNTDASVLKDADLILVCVKSKDTQEMAQTIKDSGNTKATVFSLQNGVANTKTIQTILTNHTVLPVMVPYNVVYQTGGHFHCGTEGNLYCQQHPKAQALLQLAHNAQLGFELKDDMPNILWGKLLLNLNNPINALAGIPLKQQLETVGFRKIYRDCLKEGLQVLNAADIKPGKVAAVPVAFIPYILALPTLVFKRIAQTMLAMDPKARSSMWEDLQNNRPVEVDYINGEIVKLGKLHNIPTPLNEQLMTLVKNAQKNGLGSPNLLPHQIRN